MNLGFDFIINSPLLTADEYDELRLITQRISLNDKQIGAMRRYEIESFYNQDVSEDIIRKDNDGLYRRQIREYNLFHMDDEELTIKDKSQTDTSMHITDKKNYLANKRFLQDAFKLSGLLDDNNVLIPDKEVTTENLEEFSDFVKKNSGKIQQWYEMTIRNDLSNKPIRTLNELLKIIGVKTKRATRKVGGDKKYYYHIPKQCIDELNEICKLRSDATVTEKWHLDRNIATENRLFDDERSEYYQDIRGQVEEQIRETIG